MSALCGGQFSTTQPVKVPNQHFKLVALYWHRMPQFAGALGMRRQLLPQRGAGVSGGTLAQFVASLRLFKFWPLQPTASASFGFVQHSCPQLCRASVKYQFKFGSALCKLDDHVTLQDFPCNWVAGCGIPSGLTRTSVLHEAAISKRSG